MSGVGLTNAFKGVSNTVSVQAVNTSGNYVNTGGDVFFLRVENLCYLG